MSQACSRVIPGQLRLEMAGAEGAPDGIGRLIAPVWSRSSNQQLSRSRGRLRRKPGGRSWDCDTGRDSHHGRSRIAGRGRCRPAGGGVTAPADADAAPSDAAAGVTAGAGAPPVAPPVAPPTAAALAVLETDGGGAAPEVCEF